MILSAQLLDTYDRCPRRFAFERTHEPRTISPLGLLYAAVEGSLTASDPCQGARDAVDSITQRMDVNAGDLSSISAVRHVACMAEVIALALREKLGQGTRLLPMKFGDHEWKSNLFECRDTLHRIILASHIDDDSLRSFAHSWQTIGELAALERSITLTVVIIGAQRGGRRHSPWSKGFLHPVQKTLRFAPRNKDKGFTDNWKTVWREQSDIKAETWLDKMKLDNMLPDLIASRRVNYKGDDARMIQAKREMLEIIPLMECASVNDAMRRSSCDPIARDPCPWQAVDYSATPVTPDDFPHLYRARETPLVTLGPAVPNPAKTTPDHNEPNPNLPRTDKPKLAAHHHAKTQHNAPNQGKPLFTKVNLSGLQN